jgi:hypothetical protein
MIKFVGLVPKLEPAMPRRKKYPDLAYRHHEFLISDGEITANGMCNTESRARSEERGPHWRPSRRSKSEGPRCGAYGDGMRERERRRESDPDLENMVIIRHTRHAHTPLHPL